jgi:hypothetical protein
VLVGYANGLDDLVRAGETRSVLCFRMYPLSVVRNVKVAKFPLSQWETEANLLWTNSYATEWGPEAIISNLA